MYVQERLSIKFKSSEKKNRVGVATPSSTSYPILGLGLWPAGPRTECMLKIRQRGLIRSEPFVRNVQFGCEIRCDRRAHESVLRHACDCRLLKRARQGGERAWRGQEDRRGINVAECFTSRARSRAPGASQPKRWDHSHGRRQQHDTQHDKWRFRLTFIIVREFQLMFGYAAGARGACISARHDVCHHAQFEGRDWIK